MLRFPLAPGRPLLARPPPAPRRLHRACVTPSPGFQQQPFTRALGCASSSWPPGLCPRCSSHGREPSPAAPHPPPPGGFSRQPSCHPAWPPATRGTGEREARRPSSVPGSECGEGRGAAPTRPPSRGLQGAGTSGSTLAAQANHGRGRVGAGLDGFCSRCASGTTVPTVPWATLASVAAPEGPPLTEHGPIIAGGRAGAGHDGPCGRSAGRTPAPSVPRAPEGRSRAAARAGGRRGRAAAAAAAAEEGPACESLSGSRLSPRPPCRRRRRRRSTRGW